MRIRTINTYYSHRDLGVIEITRTGRDGVLFRNDFGNGPEFHDNLSYDVIKEIELTIEWLSVFDFEEIEKGVFLSLKAPIHLPIRYNYITGKFYVSVLNFGELKTVNQVQEIFLALMNFKLSKK